MAQSIKFIGVFDGLSIKKDGKLDIHFELSADQLSSCLPVVGLTKTYLSLSIAIHHTGEIIEIAQVAYKALNIKAEGDARLSFESDLENTGDLELTVIQSMIERPVVVTVAPLALLGALPGMEDIEIKGFGG